MSYIPHITLYQKVFSEENLINKLENLKIPKKFSFEKIGIGIMGNYSSVRKILYVINL